VKQKVILITGASAGIGMASAQKLIERGHVVYAAARRVEKMDELKKRGAFILSMDVTNESSMREGVEKVINEQGRIDVLINNAGYGSLGAIEEVDIDEARRQFEVNLFAVARLSQLVLPHMRKVQKGRIVNISSIGARVYEPLCGWYHSTKFALEGMSDCMRLELKQFGVDLILVRPGFIRTEWDKIAHESLQKFSMRGPYRGTANKMANAHLNYLFKYFASDAPVVANTIVRAVESRRPSARYVCGKAARTFILARKLLPDSLLDIIFMKMLSFFGKEKRTTSCQAVRIGA
jgi:short-subunit dehydrogenase